MLSNHTHDKTFIKGIGKKVMAVFSEFKFEKHSDIFWNYKMANEKLLCFKYIRWNSSGKVKWIVPLVFFVGLKICSLTEFTLPSLPGAKHWRVDCSCSGVSHSSQDRIFFSHCYVPWELTGIYSWIITLWQVCDICINSN